MYKTHDLPKRVFNSPLVEYVNFEDDSHVNLIRLIKPYKSGECWAVYETLKTAFSSSRMFKSYEIAKKEFESVSKTGESLSSIRERGLTGN